MNTRRKFLLQGGIAATALLAVKPFETFAETISPVTGCSLSNNKVILLHTGMNNNTAGSLAIGQVNEIKKNTGNLLLLNAGPASKKNITALAYDASLSLNNSIAGDYKIIYKAGIKIGIISAAAGQYDVIAETNALSAYLKKQKECQLVICLSQLGYKNNTGNDDRTLAQRSADLDIIIGGHATNFSTLPVIVHNSNKEEVIIHSATDNGFALGNIEICFDKKQNKRSVDFNNMLSRV